MSPPRKLSREEIALSKQLINRSRNEAQKTVLLVEVARLRGLINAAELCQKSEKLVSKSKELCGKNQGFTKTRKTSLRKAG